MNHLKSIVRAIVPLSVIVTLSLGCEAHPATIFQIRNNTGQDITVSLTEIDWDKIGPDCEMRGFVENRFTKPCYVLAEPTRMHIADGSSVKLQGRFKTQEYPVTINAGESHWRYPNIPVCVELSCEAEQRRIRQGIRGKGLYRNEWGWPMRYSGTGLINWVAMEIFLQIEPDGEIVAVHPDGPIPLPSEARTDENSMTVMRPLAVDQQLPGE